MNRLVIALFVAFCFCGISIAQEVKNETGKGGKYTFKYAVDLQALSEIDHSFFQPHAFGEIVARKLYMVQDLYTYVEAATPTSPSEKTIVLKPNIYNSVLKLNRYYKKQVKKGLVKKEDAAKDLDYCLNVAISTVATQTDSLEADIRKAVDMNEIANIFLGVELWK